MLNLLIATTNAGKVNEFEQLLANTPIKILNLSEFKTIHEPIEDGKTFKENAQLKAVYYALKTNCWALADDSGLEVESLNNAPGIYSARYAGEDSSDSENVEKLLVEINKSNDKQRKARFICEMIISNESGKVVFSSSGICEGRIAQAPTGTSGFGYDPIFIPNGFTKSFGELPSTIKQQISHRAKAFNGIIEFLHKFRSS